MSGLQRDLKEMQAVLNKMERNKNAMEDHLIKNKMNNVKDKSV